MDLKKNVRAWTDVSGQHEIEAVYVSRTEKEITLRTEAGREIKMPIKKLSKKDQSLLESLEPDSENPFAP